MSRNFGKYACADRRYFSQTCTSFEYSQCIYCASGALGTGEEQSLGAGLGISLRPCAGQIQGLGPDGGNSIVMVSFQIRSRMVVRGCLRMEYETSMRVALLPVLTFVGSEYRIQVNLGGKDLGWAVNPTQVQFPTGSRRGKLHSSAGPLTRAIISR